MGDVRASLPYSIVMVSYQKYRWRLRAVVEILKMIWSPIPISEGGPSGGCTTYFHTFSHFLHAAYDVRGKDMLRGSSMLVVVRRLNEDLFAGALALSFCLGLSLYRYMTYCTPELPKHPKKELEELLPC